MAARKKKCSKSSQTASKKDVMLYKLSSTLAETKTIIAACSVKPKGASFSEYNSDQYAPVSGDAGNYFGGHASKCTKALLASPLALVLFGLIMFINFPFWCVRGA